MPRFDKKKKCLLIIKKLVVMISSKVKNTKHRCNINMLPKKKKWKQVQNRLTLEKILIMIKSIYKSESHLCSSKQIIISLKCLCLSYITMRNNDTINNKLYTCTHTYSYIDM